MFVYKGVPLFILCHEGAETNPTPQAGPEHAPLIITEKYVLFLA